MFLTKPACQMQRGATFPDTAFLINKGDRGHSNAKKLLYLLDDTRSRVIRARVV